jgi:hypothetical protein
MITGPFLRTSRSFPEDLHILSIEMNKAYIDIANAVNVRTMGLFPSNMPSQNGETWYFRENSQQSDKHQGFRQVYTFATSDPTHISSIKHGINFANQVDLFTRCYGSYTDGTNWYGLIFGGNQLLAGQITFFISPNSIVFGVGAGAPAVTNGIVVLEWVSNV